MRRRFQSLVAFTALLLCLVPTTAHAANEMGLSWDGTTWSGQLSGPMFDPTLLWVPGDVETKEFHVRNEAGTGANLTIAVISQDEDNLLRYADIKLSARVGSDDWMDLERVEENFRLNSDALPAGESRKVDVRAHFDFASPNRSQNKALTLHFRVTLSEAQASPGDPGNPGDVTPQPTLTTDPGDVTPQPTATEGPSDGTPQPTTTAGPGGVTPEPTTTSGSGIDTPNVPAVPGSVDAGSGTELPAATDPSDGSNKPAGALPNAGAPAVGWVIIAAGIAIGAGLPLATRRKREDIGHDSSH